MINYFLMPHPSDVIPEISFNSKRKLPQTLNAFKKAFDEIDEINPDTIILISSHENILPDTFLIYSETFISGSLEEFNLSTLSVKYEVDLDLTKSIIETSKEYSILTTPINTETNAQHDLSLNLPSSACIPLYFHKNKKNTKLVYITYSLLSKIDHIRFGNAIKDAILKSSKNVVVISSMNLSYIGNKSILDKSSLLFDKTLINDLNKGDMVKALSINESLVQASKCSYKPLAILLGLMNTLDAKADIYSYESPFNTSHILIRFTPGTCFGLLDYFLEIAKENHLNNLLYKNPYTTLSRKSLIYYFKYGNLPKPEIIETSGVSNSKLGVFVSLSLDGALRGYAGNVIPQTQNLKSEIIKATFDAAFKDKRFPKLTFSELLSCKISVYVVTHREEVPFIHLDYYVYGVTIRGNGKSASLLPNTLGIRNTFEQVNLVQEMAGLDDKEDFTLERFKVIKFEE
ncbi:MAG: AMMECR1 domain-containing protein [Clostridium sp.]|uniref:AMMECR1 domain-containing protein n=1 Tax=Clostridium sp. TaxID=1506 RepID=UPI003F3C84A4